MDESETYLFDDIISGDFLQKTIHLLEKYDGSINDTKKTIHLEIKKHLFENLFPGNSNHGNRYLHSIGLYDLMKTRENEVYNETVSRILHEIIKESVGSFLDDSFDVAIQGFLGLSLQIMQLTKHRPAEYNYVAQLLESLTTKINQKRMKSEIDYLESMESLLLFVDCAGIPARTSKLFTNQTFSPQKYIDEWTALSTACKDSDIVNQELTQKFSQVGLPSPASANSSDVLFENWRDVSSDEKLLIKEEFWKHHGRQLNENLLSKKSHDMFQRYIGAKGNELSIDPGVCILAGEPGFGKSIAMKQACLRHVQEEIVKLEHAIRLEDTYRAKLPIYYEAKKLASHLLKLHKSEWEEGLDAVYLEFYNWNEELIIDDLMVTYPELDISCLQSIGSVDSCNLIYFVDAYDECSEDEKKILSLFIRYCLDIGKQVVVSTRTNDVENLRNNIRDIEFLTFEDEQVEYRPDIVLNLTYDKTDLQETMPKQLAMAWGIDEISYKDKVAKTVDSYQKVLSHPVFVGLFCRLLQEDDLPDMKEVHLIDESFAGYTVRHVKFYQIVIEKAIEHAVKKRHKNRKKKDLERYTEAFYRIAWHNEFSELKDISKVIEYVSARYQFHFDEQDKQILRDDMGLVYARGTEVSWVHRTLKELAIGTLLATQQVFSERLKRTQNSGRRRMKNLHSFAVLTYCVQRITPTDDTLVGPLVAALTDLGDAASEAIFEEIGAEQPVFKTLKKNHEYSLVKDIDPVWKKIAEHYIQQGSHNIGRPAFLLPELAFQKLSSRGMAVIQNDFQTIDLRSFSNLTKLAFPDMLPQDMLWKYDGAQGHQYIRQIHYLMKWFEAATKNGRIPKNSKFTMTWKAHLRTISIEHINNYQFGQWFKEPRLLNHFATDLKKEEVDDNRELEQLALEVFSRNDLSELDILLVGDRPREYQTSINKVISDLMTLGKLSHFGYRLMRFMSSNDIRESERLVAVMDNIPPQNKSSFVSLVMTFFESENHFSRRGKILVESETSIQEAASQVFELFTQRQCKQCDKKVDLHLIGKLNFDREHGPPPAWYCADHHLQQRLDEFQPKSRSASN
jgi:hypothetical protein